MTQVDLAPAAPGGGAAERHVSHAALLRPVLVAGVEPAVAIVEATTVFALLFVVGLHVATVLLAAFYLTAVHGVMAWVARQDAQLVALYVRSVGMRDFYYARATLTARPPHVRPAIPTRT